VLVVLGERETGNKRFLEAIQACHEALKERTRERVPLEWASTQSKLGFAFADLGVLETGTAKLEAAVKAFDLALEEWTPETAPYYSQQIQSKRAWVLNLLEARRGKATSLSGRKPRS